MKLTSATIMKTRNIVLVIFFICFAAFVAFNIFIRPTITVAWVEPLMQSLLFFIVGATFTVFSLIIGFAAWKMSADEYYDLLTAHGSWGQKSLSICSKKYWHWQGRLLVFPMTLMTLFISIIGLIGLINILIRIS